MAGAARETNEAIGLLIRNINTRLARCEGHANFGSMQIPEARRIRDSAKSAQRRASEIWSAIHNDPLKAAVANRDEQQRLNNDISQIQEALPPSGAARNAAEDAIKLKRIEIDALKAQHGKLDQQGRKQAEENLNSPSAELDQVEQDLAPVLDAVSHLERELEVVAKERLQEVVRTDFESKAKLFESGEMHHKQQATFMLYAMTAAIGLSLALIVGLFFFVKPDVGATSETNRTVMIVEHAILIGAGRIAIIFLAAWSVKYAADLHRSHAEQSIIYRDRRAALGVAEVLLTATPELEQKRDVLKMLSEGYLNFEQSAFRSKGDRPEPKSDGNELQRIKEVAEAVKPLVEVVRPLVETAKGAADKAK